MEGGIYKRPKIELEPKDVLINTLEFSLRAINLLEHAGVKTLQDLADNADIYLGEGSNLNSVTKREIKNILKEKGLYKEVE